MLDAIEQWPNALSLAGIEVYEGVLSEENAIRDFLRRAVETLKRAHGGRLLRSRSGRSSPVRARRGTTSWPRSSRRTKLGMDAEVVLRPGCYLTHDVGIYRKAQEQIQQRNSVAARMGAGLLPALQLWAYVQSVPEPESAIVALGKRDAAFDAGLPTPALHFRPGTRRASPRRRPRTGS